MSKFLRAVMVITTIALGASVSHAQVVAMAGQYSEANGIIVDIPQNPPKVACTQAGDARCIERSQAFFGGAPNVLLSYPIHGNVGAGIVSAADATPNVGDAFTIPGLFFQQNLGLQVGQVIGNVVRQLNTTLIAAMPGTNRIVNPPATTRQFAARVFSPANVAAHGQNNGLTTLDPNYAYRQAVVTSHTASIGQEVMLMNYGGGGFTGTMATLLDGTGLLYLGGPALGGAFPPSLLPVVGTNPIGGPTPGLVDRNGMGWDYTIMGMQDPGIIKAFPSAPSVPGPDCLTGVFPPSPVGCNLVLVPTFTTMGFQVAVLGSAMSTKHVFPWTTGTVSVMLNATRGTVVRTETLSAMGYDTVTLGGERNVGLVAGSFTFRTDGVPQTQINTQMVGASLKFTPEPGATVALISGLGLLGAFAARRRS